MDSMKFAQKIIFKCVSFVPSIILGCINIEFFSKGLRREKNIRAKMFRSSRSERKQNSSPKAIDYDVVDAGLINVFYTDCSFCEYHERHKCIDVSAKDL